MQLPTEHQSDNGGDAAALTELAPLVTISAHASDALRMVATPR